MSIVSVPTGGGIKQAAKSYGLGMAAGIVYAFLSGVFGSGFLGSVATGILTGATVKGEAGTAIAVQTGFNGGVAGLSSFMAALSGGNSDGGSTVDVM